MYLMYIDIDVKIEELYTELLLAATCTQHTCTLLPQPEVLSLAWTLQYPEANLKCKIMIFSLLKLQYNMPKYSCKRCIELDL